MPTGTILNKIAKAKYYMSRILHRLKYATAALIFFNILITDFTSEANAAMNDDPLMSMSMESLMNLEVTTVTKRKQNLRNSASAIYVIKQKDIRRSGATSLPEVLTLAPGVDVSRINSFTWGISARGLNSQFANKLLVLVDGRSVYNPYFAGVFWDSLLPSLNEIERIEVIRGPGASLWGSNAVNGVINIITMDSELTKDLYATVGRGNEEKGFARVRRGFESGKVSGRVNADFRSVDNAVLAYSGADARDEYQSSQIWGLGSNGTENQRSVIFDQMRSDRAII